MALDDSMNGRESEASAFAHLFSCKEWFENAFANFGWDSEPGVSHLQENMPTAAGLTRPFDMLRINGYVGQGQRQCAASGHGIAGIDGEVE